MTDPTPRPMHSPAVEDFLKAVYDIGRDEPASTSALADALGITSASVTAMAKRLTEAGLLNHAPYRGVTLTEAGRLVAVETIRHHRIIETYLHRALGIPWDRVHEEAERWEHVISEEAEARMDEALGFPTHDPHGAPIPTADLEHDVPDGPRLADLEAGTCGVIAEVDDGDPALLRYIGGLGLYPGTPIEVTEAAPYRGGPVTLRILTDAAAPAVGDRAAQAIRVEVAVAEPDAVGGSGDG